MSDILDIAHEMAQDLFKAGAMDEITMREIGALCLPAKRPFRPEDIRRIRAARLEQLRRDISEGLNSGEATPWDPEEIKREGRKRRAARANPSPEA